MVTKSRLKMALAHEKGVDFKKLHQKKVAKQASKKKQKKSGGAAEDSEGEEWEDDEEEVKGGAPIDDDEDDDDSEDDDEEERDVAAYLDDSASSDSEVEMEEKIARVRQPKQSALKQKPSKKAAAAVEEDDEDDDEEDPEEDIALEDLEDLPDEDKEDLVPHQRLTINNTTALEAALKRISIATDKSVPFKSHMSLSSLEPTADNIPDVMDDLKRELAFYGQALEHVKQARSLLKAENVPFSRPNDYFAEMVKDDGQMEKVKARLVEEASAKKASAEARKLRDLKKFGKQVQVNKLQERQKAKKETLDKIKTLKRKRAENSGDLGTHEADLFDVGVEEELGKHDSKKRGASRDGDRPNNKRMKKDQKYGFGGKKRHSKSGDAISSGDLSGFSQKGMKQGTKGKPPKTARLGKSRRNAGKR
ncbi:rRNA processing protein [Apiospora phragmitis]|uniref:rRNA processing protein n=1 Tax=Apiospora phragmitis TaxID=2905665 RepID=A0ABR1T600_9PEZI